MQPVTPLPNTGLSPSVPNTQRATSVNHEYLEILPDLHENYQESGYEKPNKVNNTTRSSGAYDKLLNNIHKNIESNSNNINKKVRSQVTYDNAEEEKKGESK